MSSQAAIEWLGRNERESIGRLIEWLRMASISTDPAYRDEVRRAAEWTVERLREVGFDAALRETGGGAGHPIVWATANPDAAGPHVLFYGHYDVQPVDPIDLWESGPFEPVIRGREDDPNDPPRVVARGACDDKGQVASFLEALRAWSESGGPVAGGVKMTVLIEGEEESGSVNLERFVKEHADELRACDFCLISDTGMLSATQPALTYGVRGLTYTEVTLIGPDQDLHSGLWGGRVPNPNNELVRVLAGLWDDRRRVTLPGFYDAVRPIGEDERAAWARLPFSQADALAKIGLGPEADVGEEGYSALEREWGRPTADINGVFGGYTGAGAKTVIPARATAKVSFRLVADQDPEAVAATFFAWLRERTPPGCRWEFKELGSGPPMSVGTDSRWLTAAAEAVAEATGVQPALIKSGGSIPVAGMLAREAGLDVIFMGFGLADDRVHSPNEKFELACFRMGARCHATLLGRLGGR